MYIQAIAINIAKWAYSEEKRCCTGKCIFKLVENFTLDKVVSVVHLARFDVYHKNANQDHEELRELLKFGRCLETAEVVTYFDHKNQFTSQPARIKVGYFKSLDFFLTYIYLFFILFLCNRFLQACYVLSSCLSCSFHVSIRCFKANQAQSCT